MHIITMLDEIIVAAMNAGTKKILLPKSSINNYKLLSAKLKGEISVSFYSTPLEVAKISLEIAKYKCISCRNQNDAIDFQKIIAESCL